MQVHMGNFICSWYTVFVSCMHKECKSLAALVLILLTSSIVECRSLTCSGIRETPVVDTGVRVSTDKLLAFILPAQ